MTQQQLDQKVQEFLPDLQQLRDQLTPLEALRLEFVHRFPLDSIDHLPLEEYAIGKRDNDNFCYWLERRLDEIGNMIGGTSFKFGIYFGRTKSDPTEKYRFTNRFWAVNEFDVYKKVNTALQQLLQDGANERLENLIINPLSIMFKGKILASYFPDKYINIYSNGHLDYFLKKLPFFGPEMLRIDAITKRQYLREYKEQHPILKDWTLTEYCKFLYHKVGHPKQNEEESEDLPLEELQDFSFPPVNAVKPTFIEASIGNYAKPEKERGKKGTVKGRRNFLEDYERNKIVGEKGEEYTLIAERNYLIENGRPDLADKVKHEAQENDGSGYDVLSYELDGRMKYIEVKSTQAKPGLVNFLITANEMEKAQSIPNYYIYIVYDVLGTEPKILKWKSPFADNMAAISIVPVLFRVNAKFSLK